MDAVVDHLRGMILRGEIAARRTSPSRTRARPGHRRQPGQCPRRAADARRERRPRHQARHRHVRRRRPAGPRQPTPGLSRGVARLYPPRNVRSAANARSRRGRDGGGARQWPRPGGDRRRSHGHVRVAGRPAEVSRPRHPLPSRGRGRGRQPDSACRSSRWSPSLFYERRRNSTNPPRDLRPIAEMHRQMYQAIRKRDRARSKRLMYEHLRTAEQDQLLVAAWTVDPEPHSVDDTRPPAASRPTLVDSRG